MIIKNPLKNSFKLFKIIWKIAKKLMLLIAFFAPIYFITKLSESSNFGIEWKVLFVLIYLQYLYSGYELGCQITKNNLYTKFMKHFLSEKVDLEKWMNKDNWNILQASCICAGYEPPEDLNTNIVAQIEVCYKNPKTKYFVDLFGEGKQSYAPDSEYNQIDFISSSKDEKPIVIENKTKFIEIAMKDKNAKSHIDSKVYKEMLKSTSTFKLSDIEKIKKETKKRYKKS